MRHRWVRTIGILCGLLAAAGCAETFQSLNERGEQFQHNMKARGVEVHGGKAMKVYRF